MPPKSSDLIKEVRQNVNNGMTPEEARKTVRDVQRGPVQPTVSANEIANPPAKVVPPLPNINTNDGSRTSGIIDNTTTNTDGFIQSQSENAQKRDELAQLLGTQTFDAAGQREDLTSQYGVTDNLSRLQDIQTQLAKRNTDTELQKSRIAAAGGQTLAQGGREQTQADREAAIRDAGLAAEANVLQGNIETASTLINNAMQDFYSDRTLKNTNMINQLEYFSGIADAETKQLLDKETRKYEEDQRQIIRAETAVDAAATSGYATADDIKKLTSLAGDPAAQASYAQTIVANAAREAASIERQKLAISQAGLDLERRGQLYELAALGDPEAITELGFDPTAPKKEAEIKKIDAQINEATSAEQKITDLLSNKIGLQSSSGEWQFGEAFIRGNLGQAGNENAGLFGDGNVGLYGSAKAQQLKSTFLANADYLLTKEGLLEIGDLAAQDIKLTPITEKELGILFQSASVLNAAARRGDDGKLKGFSIPDTEVEKEFQNMLLSYTNVKAELAAQKNLGSSALGELEAIRQQTQQ